MPIPYPAHLVQIMLSRVGVAPVGLLDILTVDGTCFHWAQTSITAPPALLPEGASDAVVQYLPYLLNLDRFKNARSMQADTGTIDVQNISGNTIERDVETALVAHTFEGALFVLREWYPEAEAAGKQMRGRLSLDSITETDATFTAAQLFNPSSYETPQYVLSETCQWRYASIPCGADGTNPCNNTFSTCRVPERFFGVLNEFIQDLSPTVANVSGRTITRERQF
jgi:hypothetical protein